MEPFKTFKGIIAPLDRANVDTDQIIPKQFLKSIQRTGFGKSLFFDWRYLSDGKPNPDFSLNRKAFQGASILAARNNFGCGSSREHAVWAIQQYGFKAVIAPVQGKGDRHVPGFADIFRNNCGKNAVLTIELSSAEVDEIFKAVEAQPGVQATVDLEVQQLTVHAAAQKSYPFEVDSGLKERLLQGLDDIAITLQQEAALAAFESKHHSQLYVS